MSTDIPDASPRARSVLRGLAVVVLNHNGRQHLEPCIQALLDCLGLAGPEQLVVVDNASRDDSVEWLSRAHPRVRRIVFGSNLGFAEGYNRAARRLDDEWLLLLNNDTRVEAGALLTLAEAAAEGWDCLGARLLSWDGSRLDFDGGAASFSGHGHALGFGEPAVGVEDGAGDAGARSTFFASGAAMLLRRRRFLELGGFAGDFFAYYEDVDLGWRMQLAGLSVGLVPAARFHHRHHGSRRSLPGGEAARLYERNALAVVARNYDAENLRRVLPAALALAACRAADCDAHEAARLVAAADPVADAGRGGLPLPRPDWPGWAPLDRLGLDFSALARSRAEVQALRRLPDRQVLPRLLRPYAPVPDSAAARAALHAAVEHFGLEEIFGPMPGDVVPRRGLREMARLGRRAASALRRGGADWLLEETRRYLDWRRASRG